MIKKLFSGYSWVFFMLGLILLNVLFLRPTGKIISGFHRGSNYNRRETYGDLAIGVIFLFFISYILWLLIRSLFD